VVNAQIKIDKGEEAEEVKSPVVISEITRAMVARSWAAADIASALAAPEKKTRGYLRAFCTGQRRTRYARWRGRKLGKLTSTPKKSASSSRHGTRAGDTSDDYDSEHGTCVEASYRSRYASAIVRWKRSF
jgi:hypothetical protein